MKVIFLLLFLTGCSSTNDLEDNILGSWEIHSLNGETNLFKSFEGTTITFNSNGSFSKNEGPISYQGSYKIKDKVLFLKWTKEKSSLISITASELHFEEDPTFTSDGEPIKSIYKKI